VGDHFRLHLATPGGPAVETCRKIILATGFAGGGGRFIPDVLTEKSAIAALRPYRGRDRFRSRFAARPSRSSCAAAAFDAAGWRWNRARPRCIFSRAADTIAANPVIRARGFPGAYDHYHQLPDADRWYQAVPTSGPVPPDHRRGRARREVRQFSRCIFPRPGPTPWQWRRDDDRNGTSHTFDFVHPGTGYSSDIAARPELSLLAARSCFGAIVYDPRPEERDETLACSP